jgi:hypothetical protein
LSPEPALVVTLRIAAAASRMRSSELAAAFGSIGPAGISGGPGGWQWTPERSTPGARHVSDGEVIERLGALLFHALTGRALTYPLPNRAAIRDALRAERPQLPAAVVDLALDALAPDKASRRTLDAFARRAKRALGNETTSARSGLRRRFLAAAILAAMAVALGLLAGRSDADAVLDYGLTRAETEFNDGISEAAETFALTGEHTAAIQTYADATRLWRTRVPLGDPRLLLIDMQQSWVRALAGDRLTSEQLMRPTLAGLAASLGEHHPYTRAARLALAATLDARGRTNEAAALRSEADAATRALFRHLVAPDVFDPSPVPRGVLAHASPNDPHLEGFRRVDGRFVAPFTSQQRAIASRDGWQLHVMATGSCRAAVDVGLVPRRIGVRVTREAGSIWAVMVDGCEPLTIAPAEAIALSIAAGSGGTMSVRAADRVEAGALPPPPATPLDPPYTLAFDDKSACAVVWLEVRFPLSARFDRPVQAR